MSLEDRLDQGMAAAWRPDQSDPDKLVGKVIEIVAASSSYSDDPYPILVVRKEDGEEKAVHAFHSVLKREILKQRPQVGEEIGIKFLGEVKPKNGANPYIGYVVKIEREPGAFNWNAFGAPEAEPADDPYASVNESQTTVTVPAGAGDDDIPF